jgi:hypothetical protein
MASGGVTHKGNVWTTPTPVRLMGGAFWTPSTTIDWTAVTATDAWDGTADNDGTSNIAEAFDNDEIMDGVAVTPIFYFADSGISIAAGADCRSILKATSASNITLYSFSVNAAALLDVFEGGQALRYTQATTPTGAGDWTDTATKRAATGFWIDGFDDGVSTGTTIAGTPMLRGMV